MVALKLIFFSIFCNFKQSMWQRATFKVRLCNAYVATKLEMTFIKGYEKDDPNLIVTGRIGSSQP